MIGRLEAVLLILGALVSCVQLQRDGETHCKHKFNIKITVAMFYGTW